MNTAVLALVLVGLGNLIGTYIAGQWGKVHSKRLGLSTIYFGRAIIFLGFLFLPINATTILIFSGALGLLWLSTVPLTSTLVATFFGPNWMTMLYGIVFFSHQVGSFLGVWLGGVVYDRFKSYDAMWWISVALGIFAALIHLPIREAPVARLQPKPVTSAARANRRQRWQYRLLSRWPPASRRRRRSHACPPASSLRSCRRSRC